MLEVHADKPLFQRRIDADAAIKAYQATGRPLTQAVLDEITEAHGVERLVLRPVYRSLANMPPA